MFHQLIRRGLLKRRAWARTSGVSALHARTRLKQLPDGITLKKVHVVFARPPPDPRGASSWEPPQPPTRPRTSNALCSLMVTFDSLS